MWSKVPDLLGTKDVMPTEDHQLGSIVRHTFSGRSMSSFPLVPLNMQGLTVVPRCPPLHVLAVEVDHGIPSSKSDAFVVTT